MRMMLVVILAVFAIPIVCNESFAETNTFFDSVKFIQYLDENTALEEVRNGNLDVYYYTVSPDRLKDSQDRSGLHVFDSTGGSYSILVNPAESENFNPFSVKEIRFALNYLIDRKLIVNELMGGYGHPIISYYGPSDPEYLTVIEQLEAYNLKYNPSFADETITQALDKRGAVKENNRWQINGSPIEITIFIRSDDPVRKSAGEILAAELEKIGFTVKRDYGDLNKAFVIVYGSDPAEMKWNLYTEGWGRSAFVRYDSTGLGQMYAPWFSNMPGFNDPSYWNYENAKLDYLTQSIYTGDFKSSEQRDELIQQAVTEGIDESVRIFLASKIDQYVVNEEIAGVVNDFGAGVPSRFTPINARGGQEELVIGVKQVYQGAWNPVMGLTDSYSNHIWGIISDPATFKHPFTGETFPVRATWNVETQGPDGKLGIPQEAENWDPVIQEWRHVDDNTQTTSKVTFDFKFSNWHNGQRMDMNDILHSLYFTIEWGTQTDKNDKTFDTEFTPRASQGIQTIKGINQIDADTIEVYVDYWHFDEGEIADWAVLWSAVPWEITEAMERAVTDGKVSFSRSGATSKNINWLSLIIPKDAGIIRDYLQEFKDTGHIPRALKNNQNQEYYQDRYDASIDWIDTYKHAVISNGPFYLEYYSPESRTIRVSASDDDTYPFKKGKWSEFENTEFPSIKKIDIKQSVQRGEEISINIKTVNADSVLYFITDGQGEIFSDTHVVTKDDMVIDIPTDSLSAGANNIKIFAVSATVLRPDLYESSFIVTRGDAELPEIGFENVEFPKKEPEFWFLLIPAIAAVAVIIYLKRR